MKKKMDDPTILRFLFLTALIGYTVKFLRENDKPKVVVVLKRIRFTVLEKLLKEG
ncbi:hypothetical protein GCM10020331_079600 [Ectobacillus funiculus]